MTVKRNLKNKNVNVRRMGSEISFCRFLEVPSSRQRRLWVKCLSLGALACASLYLIGFYRVCHVHRLVANTIFFQHFPFLLN